MYVQKTFFKNVRKTGVYVERFQITINLTAMYSAYY